MAQRAFFMEPCPACNRVGTYGTHAEHGYATCHGCEEKMCSYCFTGCRYTCKYAQTILQLPPPPKLERQLTESKWESAEDYLKEHPEKTEVLAAQSRNHIYKVVRRGDVLVRVHNDEVCVFCGRSDIRYPEHQGLYHAHGFMCGKCISSS